MGLEQRLRDDLRGVPPTLIPRTGLADGVLATVRSRRRIAQTAAAAAILVILGGLAVVVPEVTRPSGGGSGRAKLIHLYTTAEAAFLLDEATGDYKRLAFAEAALSPDLKTVAVSGNDGRVGLATRDGILRRGANAVSWTEARGTAPLWSPDGSAVLVTDVLKDSGLTFVARRVDTETRKITDTVLPGDIIGQAGWAADSRRYLVLLKQSESGEGVSPGSMRYVEPDATLGPTIDVEGGQVAGYSSDGVYLLLDSSRLMSPKPLRSKLIDLSTGKVVREFTARPLGWVDRLHYVLLTGLRLELVDAATGEVDEVIQIDRDMAALTGASLTGGA